MKNSLQPTLRERLARLDQMPSIPVALLPLLRSLEQPLDRLEMQEIVDLILQDGSLAAQCLHLVNSPLFGQWQTVDSIRGAVALLGMQRMRDIAVSCSVLKLMPNNSADFDPVVFWEHSLACALVCRHFAQRVGFSDPRKAYLSGLLHDIGIVAHLWIEPKGFQAALRLARTEGLPLHQAEQTVLGQTHCETGKIVAVRWRLNPDLAAVVGCHHEPASTDTHRGLVAIVSLSDLLCRMNGLGYGYVEQQQVSFAEEPCLAFLVKEYPSLKIFDWARFTFEVEAYLEEVQRVVALTYSIAR